MSDIAAPSARFRRTRQALAVSALIWAGLRQFFFGILPATGLAILLFLLVREMRREDIEVAPIAVPAKLAEAGLTSEVIALRLLDQVEAAARAARAEVLERPTTELAGSQPDFNVPIAGLSLRSTAQLLRRVFGYPERRVTGELVLEPNDRLALRLRLSGHGQVADLRGHPASDVDGLLRDAAPLIWRPLAPRLYAWWVSENVRDQQQVRDRLASLRRSLATVDPETERTLLFLTARSLVRSGRSREALPLFERLVAEHPAWPGSWSGRALARAALNQAAGAVEDLRRAIALDPRWAAGHAQLANVLRISGHPAEALASVQAALALEPDDLGAMSTQIHALRDLRRPAEALAVAQRLVQVHADRPEAHNGMGWVLRSQNNLAGALAAFDAALALQPRHADSLIGRSDVLTALNRAEEALAAADAAIAVLPGSWSAHNARGWSLRRLGRHEDALAAFDRAIQRAEHAIWPHYGRAVTLATLNRTEEAAAALQQVVATDRDNVTGARRDLERLQARPRP